MKSNRVNSAFYSTMEVKAEFFLQNEAPRNCFLSQTFQDNVKVIKMFQKDIIIVDIRHFAYLHICNPHDNIITYMYLLYLIHDIVLKIYHSVYVSENALLLHNTQCLTVSQGSRWLYSFTSYLLCLSGWPA